MIKRRCHNPQCRRRFKIRPHSFESLMLQRVWDTRTQNYHYFCPDRTHAQHIITQVEAILHQQTRRVNDPRLVVLRDFAARHCRPQSCRYTFQTLLDQVQDIALMSQQRVDPGREDQLLLTLDTPWIEQVRAGETNVFELFKTTNC